MSRHVTSPAAPLALMLLALLACTSRGIAAPSPTDHHEEGQPAAAAGDARDDDDDSSSEEADWTEDLVETSHEIEVDGETLTYTATTGRMGLLEEDGEAIADIFFVYYALDGVDDPAERPITYCFNGGPGSSSVWLHMGAYGPRRVPMNDDATTSPPPYALIDNAYTLLDITDMVFIDPVTTGYSRATEGEDDGRFHGLNEDIDSVGEFIRLFTTRFERWPSPKFLSGESYGTTRAAGLAGELQGHHGMFLNGLVMVSSILNFATARFDAGNDLPYPLFLPTYTATAWYHGRLDDELSLSLEGAVQQARDFALGDYWSALAQGAALSAEDHDRIATELSRLLGVSKAWVERTNLRPVIHEFCKELRRDERRTVGRLDSRWLGRDADAAGASYDYDPSMQAILGPYTATLNAYVRGELGYESDLPYEILTGRVHPWNYGNRNSYVNVAETLRRAMSQNEHLKVLVTNGYYDLATPFFATEYTFDHLGLEPDLQDNVSMTYYEAGHMMYIHEPSAAKLKADIAAFYADCLDG